MTTSLTRAEFFRIRAWVGDEPDEENIQNRFEDLGGDVLETSRQILQERLGDLTSGPDSFNAQGDYSEDNKAVIELLTQQIKDLSILIDGSTIPGFDASKAETSETGRLIRTDRPRLFTS